MVRDPEIQDDVARRTPPSRAEAERPYRELFELAADGIFVADLRGRYTEVNAAGCELLGYSRDELVGKTIADLITPVQVAALDESKALLLRGEVQVAEWELRHKNGTYIPVEVSAKLLADGRWLGFVRDLRPRRAEDALRLGERRFRTALAGSPIYVFSQDRDLRYTWVFNPPAPYRVEAMLGKTQFEVTPRDLSKDLDAFKRRVLESGLPGRKVIEIELAAGRRFYDVAIEPLRDDRDRIIGIAGASWDVTDRVRGENEHRLLDTASAILAQANLEWKELLRTIAPLALRLPADLCVADIVDEDGKFERLDVAHVDPAKAAICSELNVFALDRTLPHLTEEVMRTREARLVADVTSDYLDSISQGPRHRAVLGALDLRSMIHVPLSSRGVLFGAFAIGSSARRFDADDLRLARSLADRIATALDNARLRRALERAVKAREEVLAIVAHDLRNPLNSVLLQSELLARMVEEDTGSRALERIRRSVRRMNRLIQDLLDVVRIDAHEPLTMQPELVAPRDLAEEAIAELQSQAAAALVELQLACAPDIPLVRADRHRLMQVLDNLIGNAIKFSPRGATVALEVTRAGELVRFSIRDAGPGMHADQIPHLFERFWQGTRGDRRGVGLGLFVVNEIVKAHGGEISVESALGQGTTFHVTLAAAG